MSTIVARCTNLNTKIDKARMMMLRLLRKERFSVGFGCNHPSPQCRRQEEDSGGKHRDDHAGVQPVQPLPLIQRAVKKGEATG